MLIFTFTFQVCNKLVGRKVDICNRSVLSPKLNLNASKSRTGSFWLLKHTPLSSSTLRLGEEGKTNEVLSS